MSNKKGEQINLPTTTSVSLGNFTKHHAFKFSTLEKAWIVYCTMVLFAVVLL